MACCRKMDEMLRWVGLPTTRMAGLLLGLFWEWLLGYQYFSTPPFGTEMGFSAEKKKRVD